MQKNITRFFGLAVICTFLSVSLSAQTNTFIYTTTPFNNDWNDPANWSLGTVPVATDDVDIPSNAFLVTPRVFHGFPAVCHDLNITGNADLALEDALTVNGVVNHTGTGRFFIQRDGGKQGALVLTNPNPCYFSTPTCGGATFMFDDGGNFAAGYRDMGTVIPGFTIGQLGASGITLQGANAVDCYYNYSPYPNVQYYNEQHPSIVNGAYYERWVSTTNPAITMPSTLGFAVRTDAPGPFSLTMNGGTGSQFESASSAYINVFNSNPGTGQGWNMLSNSWPASLDMAATLTDNPLFGTAYVFRTTGQFSGNYGSINSAGVTSGFLTDQYIAPAQGFFVHALINSTFAFNRTHTTGNTAHFHKTNVIANEVRLMLDNGHDADQIVAYTDGAATAGEDMGLDAEKFVSRSTADLSFINNGKGYAINALNTIDATTVLPFDIAVSDAGNYTLKLSAYSVNGLVPYLRDNQSGTLTNLSMGNTVTLALGANAQVSNRYAIAFKMAAANGINEITQTINLFSHDNTLFVNRDNSNAATIQVYNTMGQLLSTTATTSAKEAINLNGFKGTVMVRVAEGTNTQVAKAFIN